MQRLVRTKALPPAIWRSPALAPLSQAMGARPASSPGRALTEFWEANDERDRGDGCHARNAEEDFVSAFEAGIGVETAADFQIQALDVFSQTHQSSGQFGLEKGRLAGAALIAHASLIRDRGGASANQFLQIFKCSGRGRQGFGIEGLAHQRHHSGVDEIGLGELARGLGEQARPRRIDDGEARGVQASVGLPVKLGHRLPDDQGHRHRREPSLEGAKSLGRVGRAQFLADGVEVDVEDVFTNVDADVDSGFSASFGRFLTLHAGLAPNHLFRTSARDGPTKLSHGSTSRVMRSRPPDTRGAATPRVSARALPDSGQSEHARVAHMSYKLRVATRSADHATV